MKIILHYAVGSKCFAMCFYFSKHMCQLLRNENNSSTKEEKIQIIIVISFKLTIYKQAIKKRI